MLAFGNHIDVTYAAAWAGVAPGFGPLYPDMLAPDMTVAPAHRAGATVWC